MPQYNYSIIIPHKNIPDLLQRCLDSIPKRDDVQIIIVDDNSASNIVSFSHFPGLNQPNTEVYFDKTGRGAGRARNVGLNYAKGEWILFADCDDYYNTENLDELFNQIIPSTCNVVFWAIQHKNFDGSIWCDTMESTGLLSRVEKKMFFSKFAPWRKMVRQSHIKAANIKFEEIIASNDVMFHTHIMGTVKDDEIMFFSKYIYTWEQRNDSITHGVSIRKALCRFHTSLRANRYALNKGWQIIDSTYMHQTKIYRLSHFLFFFTLYWEWIYLGWNQASIDYRNTCQDYGERLCLHLHPLLWYQTIRRRLK